MRQILLIASATVLGFGVGGCDFLPFGQGGDTTTTTPSPVVVGESPVVVSPGSPQPSPGSPGFEQPTVQPQNSPQGILPPDLISSTDPNQRIQQVKGERPDPFALLPATPTVQLPEGATLPPPTTIAPPPNPTGAGSPTAGQPRGTSPQPRRAATPPKNPAGGNAGARGAGGGTAGGAASGASPNRAGGGTGQAGSNANKPPRSPITATSPRPQPELARAVKVTGIVQVGDTVYAIVNAPNEPGSRYVQEGQRLSNGQVLVRRIETNRAEPVVVLEQYGVEVLRAVGEGIAPATAPAAVVPAAGTPAT